MKNKDKFIEQCIENVDKICDFLNVICEYKLTCNYCDECRENFAKWLEQEYIEKPKLSYDEYVILKNISKTFKWITRDAWDLFTNVHADKPKKKIDCWEDRLGINNDLIFDRLFQFVKWEDEEPTNIQELLEEYERFDGD